MIQDKLSMFSNQQAVTASADSTNVLYVGDHADDIQRNLTLFVQWRAAATSEGDSTLVVKLYTGSTEASQATLLWTSPTFAKAALTEGASLVKIPLPTGILKYLKLTFTVGVANLTAGTVDAGLAWGIDIP